MRKKGTTMGGRRETEENLDLESSEGESRVKLLERLHFVIMGILFFFLNFSSGSSAKRHIRKPFALKNLKKKILNFSKNI